MVKIFIETYGCTLNQADSDLMEAILREKHEIVENIEDANVIIINTCTVKGSTENKIMARIRELERNKKRMVIAGCLTVNADKIRKITTAPLVGSGAINQIERAVEEALLGHSSQFTTIEKKPALPRMFRGVVARVPIQEGCVNKCSFCQTKIARPILISYHPKEVVRMVEEAVKGGAKEIQLTGTDSGAYGIDLKTNLVELLKHVVEIEGDFKIRIGMMNPQHLKRMKNEMVELMKNKKLYKFLHIPVQTGSEKVCREMKRGHSVKDFVELVEFFRKEIPEITIATDIIVGYPTEEISDFEKTKEMLEKTKPDIINLSRFTVRKGTEAEKLKPIPTEEVKRRTIEMSKVVKKVEKRNAQKYVGRVLEVIITERGERGEGKGRAKNYRQVVVKEKVNIGEIVKVNVVDATHTSLIGKITEKGKYT